MVALSATAGFDVWRTVAVSYARQQLAREDIHTAASFLVACHCIHEAVHAYLGASLYP